EDGGRTDRFGEDRDQIEGVDRGIRAGLTSRSGCGHLLAMYKIIGADQKEYGPITADQLRQWISEGRINAHTKVQPEGAGVWKSVSELPEFAAVLPARTPSAPGTPLSIAMAPAAAKSNQMALWAMITGIISLLCCPVLGPLPIVLSIVALS